MDVIGNSDKNAAAIPKTKKRPISEGSPLLIRQESDNDSNDVTISTAIPRKRPRDDDLIGDGSCSIEPTSQAQSNSRSTNVSYLPSSPPSIVKANSVSSQAPISHGSGGVCDKSKSPLDNDEKPLASNTILSTKKLSETEKQSLVLTKITKMFSGTGTKKDAAKLKKVLQILMKTLEDRLVDADGLASCLEASQDPPARAISGPRIDSWIIRCYFNNRLKTDDTYQFSAAVKPITTALELFRDDNWQPVVNQVESTHSLTVPPIFSSCHGDDAAAIEERQDILMSALERMSRLYSYSWAKGPIDLAFKVAIQAKRKFGEEFQKRLDDVTDAMATPAFRTGNISAAAKNTIKGFTTAARSHAGTGWNHLNI
eukprot:UC4_evm3s566